MILARFRLGNVLCALRNPSLTVLYFRYGNGEDDWYSGAHPFDRNKAITARNPVN